MSDEEFEKFQIEKSKQDQELEVCELGCMKEAYEKIFKKEAEKKCKMLLRMNKCEHYALQRLYNENKEMKKNMKDFYFITINPVKDTDFEEFKSAVLGVWNWCWIEKMHVAFEQRGSTPSERGIMPHAHILIEKCDNEWNKINSQFRDKFKKFCGQPYDKTINVLSKKREWLNDKLEYIYGTNKTDGGKPEKQAQDQIWRTEKKIKNIYKFELSTDKKSSNTGGARKNCGVKKGDKRGNYKKKTLVNPLTNSQEIIKKGKKIVEF